MADLAQSSWVIIVVAAFFIGTLAGAVYICHATRGAAPAPPPPPAPAADDWLHVIDDDGDKFFYNPATRESAWELPSGAAVRAVHVVAKA